MNTVVIDRTLMRVRDILAVTAVSGYGKTELYVYMYTNTEIPWKFELPDVETRDKVLFDIQEAMEAESGPW
jgi:hypothetical protein